MKSNFQVSLGLHYFEKKNPRKVHIHKIHPEFRQCPNGRNDIAILELIKPIKNFENEKIFQPACLPASNPTFLNEKVTGNISNNANNYSHL